MSSSSSFSPATADPDAIARGLLQRAHNRDGLPEIAAGLTFLLIGAQNCAQVLLPHNSIVFLALIPFLVVLFPLACIGAPWAVRWVRRRFLIGRVGYVEYRPVGRRQIRVGILIALAAIGTMVVVVARIPQPDRWVLAGTGLFGGALLAFAGRLPRFVIGGVVMAATGLIVAFAGASLPIGFAVLFGTMGLLALISGTVRLVLFLRQPIEGNE